MGYAVLAFDGEDEGAHGTCSLWFETTPGVPSLHQDVLSYLHKVRAAACPGFGVAESPLTFPILVL